MRVRPEMSLGLQTEKNRSEQRRDLRMGLGKLAEPMHEPFGSKIR
jgi:hypothetical protein